jgi:hypothetical protein
MLENMTKIFFSGEGELFPQLVDYPWFHGTLSRSDAAAMVLNRWGKDAFKCRFFLAYKNVLLLRFSFYICHSSMFFYSCIITSSVSDSIVALHRLRIQFRIRIQGFMTKNCI